VSDRGGALHRHQKFQHARFVESDGGNDQVDWLLLEDAKGFGGGVGGDQAADAAQH
jgi:hypothetical protein